MTIDPLLAERPSRPGPAATSAAPRPSGPRRAFVAVGVCGLAALAALVVVNVTDSDATSTTEPPVTTSVSSTVAPTTTVPSIDAPGSLWWLVNPDRPLPAGYVPADLVVANVPVKPDAGATRLTAATAAAFEALVADAATAGHQLQLMSGYRSFDNQQVLYDRFVKDFGAEVAAGLVALPGTSEHQTGLAVDVGLVGLPDDQVFSGTPASAWVAANAHRFGFTLRYPPEKADITGYTNEPWHLRYVGTDLALELFTSGLTMEEHFGLVPTATGGG